MNKIIGVVLKVGVGQVSVVFPFYLYSKKYGILQRRWVIKTLKVRSCDFKKGDILYWNTNYTKVCF